MDPGNDSAETVARLKRLLERQRKTLADAGRTIGRGISSTRDLADRHSIDRRRRSLPPAKRRKIERAIRRAKLTVSEMAKKYEVAKSTVSRFRTLYIKQESGTPDLTHRLKSPQRCPGCGHRVLDIPCLACRLNGSDPR